MGLLKIDFSKPEIRTGLLATGINLLKNSNKGYSNAEALGRGLEAGLLGYKASNQLHRHNAWQNQQQLSQQQKIDRENRLQKMYLGQHPYTQNTNFKGTSNTPSFKVPSMQAITHGVILGDPIAKELFAIRKYVDGGIKRDAGSYYQDPMTGATKYMPVVDKGMQLTQNGTTVPLPGYAQTNAYNRGFEQQAIERAKAGYDVKPVYRPDGSQQFVTREQIVNSANSNNPNINQNNNQQNSSLTGYTASPSPVVQQAQQEINKHWINGSYSNVNAAGGEADKMLSSVQAIRGIDLKTGWGTDAKGYFANMLTSMGLASEEVEKYAGDVESFRSIAMDRLMISLRAQKGPQTEGDADRASKTFALLKNTPQANDFILDLAEANALRDKMRQEFYQQYIPHYRNDLSRIDAAWEEFSPSIFELGNMGKWHRNNT